MSTAMANVRLVTHPPAHSGQYVHSGMPQQVYFQMASNSFQASGESVRQKNISNSSIKAPAAISKGIYLHESQLRYYASNAAEKTLKRLDHRNPVQIQEGEYPKQPTAKIKEYYLYSQQIRQETSTAVPNLHNEPPNGIQKISVCFPAVDVRRSTTQYESAQQIQAERCHAHQTRHHLANATEFSSGKRVICLQPSGCQTQTSSVPKTTGNRVHLAFSGIQSSTSIQWEPRYPVNFQNPRVPSPTREPRCHSHPSWPNPRGFPEPGNNGTSPPSKVAPQDFVHSYSHGCRYSVLEPDLNSVQRQPSNVVVPNGVQPTLPFSHSEVPSVKHFSGGSNHLPIRQLVSDFPSSSAFISQASTAVAPGGIDIYSTIAAKSSVNPYYPDDNNLLSREYQKDPNLSKCHVYCETPKYVSAALPVRPMKAVPTDAHLVTHPPARQLPVYTQEEPIKNRSQEAHFPVRIVNVPSNGASCVTSPRPCHTDNANGPNGQPCPAEVYNTREAGQPVSISASQLFKTNGEVQYTTSYASAPHHCGQSEVNVSEGPTKVPIQYSYQTTSEGLCRAMGGECNAPNHRMDMMSSVHHKTPPYSKSNAMIAPPPSRPNYAAEAFSQPANAQVLTTSSPHFGSMNGHVPVASNNISYNENSAFLKSVHYHDAGRDQDGPHSVENSWIVPKQQQHDNDSGDSFKPSHGRPSSWSNNISLPVSPHIRRGSPTILLRDPTVCDSLVAAKEPSCYISVDSKPQVDNEIEQFRFSDTPRKCQKILQLHKEKTPCIEEEQPENKLEKLTKFVVGVESKIQWNKGNNYNNNKNKSNGSEVKDLQIGSVSSTQSPCDDSTKSPFSSSGSESDDPFCMIRLERVYYSTNTMPSRHYQSSAISEEEGSKLGECKKRKFSSFPSETHQTIANSGYSSRQTNFVPFRSKTSRDLSTVKKVRNTSYVSVAKRKANVSGAIRDGVCTVKRKKMEKNKLTIPPNGTAITALGKVKANLEILSTKDLFVRLEDVKQESEKKESRIMCKRIRKRCTRKVRINS